MNLSDLSKEQKQYIGLGLVAIAGIGYGIVFGLQKGMASYSDAKAEVEDLSGKIEKAKRAIAARDKMKSDFYDNAVVLKTHLESAPPEKNYYSWASKIIYSKGREFGVEIDSVDEIDSRQSSVRKKDSEFKILPYSLRITARGGYLQLKKLVENIERDEPLLRFTGIEISQGAEPEIHDIQLFVQWPTELKAVAEVCSRVDLSSAEGTLAKERLEKKEALVAAAKTGPTSEPVKVEPKPEPKPVVVAKKPEPVVKPEPVKVEPKPEPKPVVVAKKPEPVVKPAPRPEPVKVEPKPEPKPVVVAKKPEPVVKPAPKPEPVKVAPKPEPKPVVVAKKPEPVVKPAPKPEPVKVAPEPAPKPLVVAKKPEPVVKPAPRPEPVKVEPKPEPKPVVVAKKPEPVVKPAPRPEPVKVEPKPEPKPVVVAKKPEPVVKPAPKPVKVKPKPEPKPVIVAKKPEPVGKPASRPEPIKVESKSDPAVASLSVPSVSDVDAPVGESSSGDDLEALVASLGGQGQADTKIVEDSSSSTDASGLEAYIQELNKAKEAELKDVPEESVAVSEPVSEKPEVEDDLPVTYVSTGKSAKKLGEILGKGKPETSDSLSSFLGGIVEDINVK